MGFLSFPEFSREGLAELGGWSLLRQGRALFRAGTVKAVGWEQPILSGTVEDKGVAYEPVLDLRSLTFVRNTCGCPAGRRGQVCAHALALCLEAQQRAEGGEKASQKSTKTVAEEEAVVETVVQCPPSRELRTLRLDDSGTSLTAELTLPPNLEAAARRNAVVVKLAFRVEGRVVSPEKVYKGKAYAVDPDLVQILSQLEELGGGSLYSVVQLKCGQLKGLLEKETVGMRFIEGGQPSRELDRKTVETRILPLLEKGNGGNEGSAVPGLRRSGSVRGPTPRRSVRPPVPERDLLPDNWMVVDGSPKFLSILLREKEHPQYRGCVDWLRAEGFRKEPSNGKWWLRDQHKVLNFLALQRQRLEANYDPGYTDNFKERTRLIKPVPLHVETRAEGSGYALRLELRDKGLDLPAIRNALVSGRHYVIGEEEIHLLEREVLEKLESLSQALGGDPQLPLTGVFEGRLSGADLVHTESLLEEEDLEVPLPEDWKQRSAAIRHVGKLELPPLPEGVSERFRSYQLVGTAWLWHLYRNGLGGILADEMGLGKTIQAIGLLLAWKARGEAEGPALVVAPASLLGNWERELRIWAPGIAVYLHHGTGRRTSFAEETFSGDLILTSYSTLRNDRDLFQETSFSLAIADEAQHVKNRRSHASRSLRSVMARARFVLTGTPIENSVEDLRALFDFCLPGYLRRPPADVRGEERQWHEKQHLERAAPYILRRGKALVAPELPEKIEQTLWCELGAEQRRRYQAIREKTEETLMQMVSAGASENRMRFTMLTELLRLRQVCADPGLLDPDYPLEDSAKFRTFRELLSEAMDGGHRILVFSQFVKLLKRLREWFREQGIETAYIDGSTRDRLAVCDRFNGNPEIVACLISLKAGGTGLNLTGADTVIHFDPWWNPAVEDQATDRAHRIGQSRTVTSYKLATEGTVEDKVLALQMKKSVLLKDLLDESAQHSAKVDLETLKSLLS